MKPTLGERFLANMECIDGRVVFGDKNLVASLDVGDSILSIDVPVTFSLQSSGSFLNRKEIDGRGIEKI
jgi:hypothetical protein